MDADELTKLQVEAWKTTVQVQQHFNDIEMKIRSLAITVLTAVLAAAAVAIKEDTKLEVFGATVPLGSALLGVGAVTWFLFYFVDQIWYHRLLLGAVKHGKTLEDQLRKHSKNAFDLTKTIGDESPYQFKFPGLKFGNSPYQIKIAGFNVGTPMHSSMKLTVFYVVVEAVLVLAAVLSAIGNLEQADSKKKSSISVESAWKATATNSGDPSALFHAKNEFGSGLSYPRRTVTNR
jgi:hypothetical protein